MRRPLGALLVALALVAAACSNGKQETADPPLAEPARSALREVSSLVTYGWGMIPVTAEIGGTRWTTSLFPKDGGYLVPIKAVVQRAEELDVGDFVTIRLTVATDDR